MKFDGINEVLFDEAYDELLARYSETQEFISPCGASKPKAPAKPKAAPKAPTPPKPPTKPTASKGSQGGPKKKKPCPPKATSRMSGEGDSFSEFDFVTCQRPDGTTYGTGGQCRKGVQISGQDTLDRGKHREAHKEFLSKLSQALPEDTKAIVGGFQEVEMATKTKGGTQIKVTFSPKEGFNFTVNGDWNNGSVTDRREQVAVALKVKKYWSAVTKALPVGTTVQTSAWDKDNSYDARVKAYERMGFSSPTTKGGKMFAEKTNEGIKPGGEKGYKAQSKNADALWFSERSSKQEVRDWLTIIFGLQFAEDFSEPERHDFAQTCQRPDGSTYGTAGQCRKGTPTTKGEEAQIQAALKELKGYKAGYQKTGGDNLQDPGEAAKYADFYTKDKDLSYKAPKETRPEVVKETLARLKEDDPAQYTAVMKSLNSKGSPEKTMKAEAGWKGSERGEAVLKSLMDNDFKDVLGNPAPWGQGLQLDHRTAGSVGGKDLPKNWIWISTATNQSKGGYEAAAKKIKGTGAEKEAFIKASLIKGLQANAK